MSKELTTALGGAADVLKRLYTETLKTTKSYKMFPMIEMQHGIKKPKFEIEGHEETATFTGTIVNFTVGREYYPSPDVKAPECTSVGGDNGTDHGKCKVCNFYKWGSGNGTSGRKCKEHRKVLLSLEGKPGLFELKVPTTSLKAFDDFKSDIAIKEKSPLQMVVAKFSLTIAESTGKKPYSILVIEKDKALPDADPQFIEDTVAAIQKYETIYIPTPLSVKVDSPSVNAENAEPQASEKVSDKVTVAEGDEVPF